MKSIFWNTCRDYTVNGQRIGARRITDKVVMFADIDRGISGLIDIEMDGGIDRRLNKNEILRLYDYGQYRSIWSEPVWDVNCKTEQVYPTEIERQLASDTKSALANDESYLQPLSMS